MATLALPLITAGISGLAGLFGNKNKTTKSTSDTTQNQSGSQSGLNTNIMSELQGNLANTAGYAALQQMRNAGDTSGIVAQGLQKVNEGGDIRSKILKNILASRGLSFSPTASSAVAQGESDRVGQGTEFLSQVPQLQRQMQMDSIKQLMSVFSALPMDTATNQNYSSSGETHTTGTGTQPGSPTAGLLGGFGAGLMAPNSPGGGSNLSSILARMGIK
jgi:hypothetical protein